MYFPTKINEICQRKILEEKILVPDPPKVYLRSLGCDDAELYGAGKHLRRYGFYPQSLPICCMTQHGVSIWDAPQNYQLESNFPYMLVSSKRMETAWKTLSSKPCFTVRNPFSLETHHSPPPQKKRQGTLFFYSHSTKEIDTEIDFSSLFKSLKTLPQQFYPITICLHFRDIEKGIHLKFLEEGWNCDTAGHWDNPLFSKTFYNMLSRHKFAMSNSVGSYTFYAVHAGIPFSLVGPKPTYNNRCDQSLPLGLASNTFIESQKSYKLAHELFAGIHTRATSDQIKFTDSELGIQDSISRLKLSMILYSSLLTRLKNAKGL